MTLASPEAVTFVSSQAPQRRPVWPFSYPSVIRRPWGPWREVVALKTLVLCGGRGTRAYPYTVDLPKPLLEVAGRPVVRHLMEIYAEQGFAEFVLAAGYRSDLMTEFVTDLPEAWSVELVDTGEDTNTGGRVEQCRDRMGDTFFLTYADGLGNVDLARLAEFHLGHGGAATVTTVPLPSPYGTLDLDDSGRVRVFREKPRLPDHLINAGFFVVDQLAFDHWRGDDLERQVLPELAAVGELFGYLHTGFWQSMDTYKDALALTALCQDGAGPWVRSGTRIH